MRTTIYKEVSTETSNKIIRGIVDLIESMVIVEAGEKVNPQLKTNQYITRSITASGDICYNWGGGMTPYYDLKVTDGEEVHLKIKTNNNTAIMIIDTRGIMVVVNGEYNSSIDTIVSNILPKAYWEEMDINKVDFISIKDMRSIKVSMVSGTITKDIIRNSDMNKQGGKINLAYNVKKTIAA